MEKDLGKEGKRTSKMRGREEERRGPRLRPKESNRDQRIRIHQDQRIRVQRIQRPSRWDDETRSDETRNRRRDTDRRTRRQRLGSGTTDRGEPGAPEKKRALEKRTSGARSGARKKKRALERTPEEKVAPFRGTMSPRSESYSVEGIRLKRFGRPPHSRDWRSVGVSESLRRRYRRGIALCQYMAADVAVTRLRRLPLSVIAVILRLLEETGPRDPDPSRRSLS